jgi:2-methylisocitrate lyase-like PEP mutase family enzyme
MPTPTPTRLRQLLARPGIIPSFGAHDTFSALLMERAGIELLFLGGFGSAASLLGLPDLHFLTLTEMADAVRRVAGRVSVPVIADGDTGHGDLIHVQRTVREFERAGAAGIILEDQASPKRCGHFEDKQLVPVEEMVLRLRAALDARSDADFVLIARTDARSVFGLEEAVHRANRYLQAGADIAFIEAPESVEELERLPAEVDGPLLVNLLTGGKTPILPVPQLEKLGYKIAVAPIESLLVTARAVQQLCAAFIEHGRVDRLAPEQMASFAEVKEILGLDTYLGLREELRRPDEATEAQRTQRIQ